MGKYLELVEGSFTDEHYAKQNNYPYVAYSVADGKVIYTIIYNGEMYTVLLAEQSDISGITYEEVDLGLPSGLKWANKNIGASTAEDYGSYFAWGDTVGYTYKGKQEVTAAELATLMQPVMFPDPTASDYVELTADNIGGILEELGITGTDLTVALQGGGFVSGRVYNWSNYFDTTDGGSTFVKYSTAGSKLESSDDAASVIMGSDWRMPTKTEIQELIDNTTKTFIDLDGNEVSSTDEYNLKGIKFTATNGNSIFIPAAGLCDQSMLDLCAFRGYVWSSELYSSYAWLAYCLFFDCCGYCGVGDDGYRYCGRSVRGVRL